MKKKFTLPKTVRNVLREGAKVGILTAFLAFLILWLSGSFREKVQPGPPAPRPAPEDVKTWLVEQRTYPLVLEQVGTVETETEAGIASRIMAQVLEVSVQEGDPVTGPGEGGAGGTVLARLDDRDIRARLETVLSRATALDRGIAAAKARLEGIRAQGEAAAASLRQARSDHERYKDLHENRAATGQQFEQARARFEVAQARVRESVQGEQAARKEIEQLEARKTEVEAAASETRVQLSHTVLRAPFSGRIAQKSVEAGSMVAPGQVLFLLEIPRRIELEAVASESVIARIRPEMKLDVRVDALQRTFEGTVRRILPRADPATRTFTVKIALPEDPALAAGLFGRVLVPAGQYEALVVPVSAVREVGQLRLVRVPGEDGHPRRRFVTLGQRHGTVVEVLSGLAEKERVVVP